MNKDIVSQITGFLTAILLFLGTLNMEFAWFTEQSINAFGLVVSAGILLGVNILTIYRNHYGFSEKAKEQKRELEKKDLL
ncbi:hypothetical protein BKM15_26005 [Pseudomonas syringae pv. syringae]|nr:hypothetical protein BKM15_26005 [Pseudomonas syringae pv. syringae]